MKENGDLVGIVVVMKFIQESLSMAARRELAAYFAKERNPAYLNHTWGQVEISTMESEKHSYHQPHGMEDGG